MKSVSGKEFAKILERLGWQLIRVQGSHHIHGKDNNTVRISEPIHGSKDLKVGLLRHFMRQANISESDLL